MNFNMERVNIDNVDFLVIKPTYLSDEEYNEIKPYIETLGGHWRERAGGFVFHLDSLSRTEKAEWQEKHQFFPTPESVAKRVVELCGLDKLDWENIQMGECGLVGAPFILEPSAGQGALLKAIPDNVKYHIKEMIVEPNEENARVLNELGHIVEEMTFEKFYNKCRYNKGMEYEEYSKVYGNITHVIMNPPFSESRDIKHTMMAYNMLKDGGTLVSIVSENALWYKNGNSREFRQWLTDVDAYIEPVPYGAFKESGTTVDTVIIKVVKNN